MRGTSQTKFIKGTDIPKHAGNFSWINSDAYKMHWQSKSYPVRLDDFGHLIVGKNTPLWIVLQDHNCHLEWLIKNDHTFKRYHQEGFHTHNGKKYKCMRTIECVYLQSWSLRSRWTLTEVVNTEGEFTYPFPDY